MSRKCFPSLAALVHIGEALPLESTRSAPLESHYEPTLQICRLNYLFAILKFVSARELERERERERERSTRG